MGQLSEHRDIVIPSIQALRGNAGISEAVNNLLESFTTLNIPPSKIHNEALAGKYVNKVSNMDGVCDISSISYFTTAFVENYVKSKSKSSGKSHVDKGYIYFREEFIKKISVGKSFSLFSII